MEHPPHPEERRRRVSKDGRPRSGLMVRDATLLTMRGQPVRPELLRRKEAGRAEQSSAPGRCSSHGMVAWVPGGLLPRRVRRKTGPGDRGSGKGAGCIHDLLPGSFSLLCHLSEGARRCLRAASLLRSHTRPALEQALERAWKRRACRRTACSCWERSRSFGTEPRCRCRARARPARCSLISR
jgi:hypothetical protein